MNIVNLSGRLTKNPVFKEGNTPYCKFTLAVDRYGKKNEADFIPVTCFGKTAELVNKYLVKGSQIGVTGRISTGSYEKDGTKVYTTDVLAERVEFYGKKAEETLDNTESETKTEIPSGFEKLTDEDIPF